MQDLLSMWRGNSKHLIQGHQVLHNLASASQSASSFTLSQHGAFHVKHMDLFAVYKPSLFLPLAFHLPARSVLMFCLCGNDVSAFSRYLFLKTQFQDTFLNNYLL